MGLRDKYQTTATPGVAPSTPPAVAPATPDTTTLPVPAAAPVATPAPVSGERDLAAVRARLAQRQSPGVNPPEGSIPEAAFDRTTKETPDGGAEPLPNHQDNLKAAAKATTQASPVGSPGESLTRGQKAAATRAANRAAAVAPAQPTVQKETEADESVASPAERIAAALEAIARALETRAL